MGAVVLLACHQPERCGDKDKDDRVIRHPGKKVARALRLARKVPIG
jgi:hypothetical protein